MECISASIQQPLNLQSRIVYYWLDNPLHTWRQVQAAMQKKELLRVLLSENDSIPRYAGYLFALDGNKFRIVKFGKPDRTYTYAEVMGLCLGAKLWVDNDYEMPDYYEKYQRMIQEGG